jgi:hypothetical protein
MPALICFGGLSNASRIARHPYRAIGDCAGVRRNSFCHKEKGSVLGRIMRLFQRILKSSATTMAIKAIRTTRVSGIIGWQF